MAQHAGDQLLKPVGMCTVGVHLLLYLRHGVRDIGGRKQRQTQQTVYDGRDVDITSILFCQTDLVASFYHCLRVVKPAADDDGVPKNVMESGHRRFFEIRHGTRRSKLRDQR